MQRTRNDFFACFFMEGVKLFLEAKMAVTRQGDRRKGIRRQSGRRKGDIEKITSGEGGAKDREIIVHHEAVAPKKASSVWSWHEEFAAEWSETFITKKKKRNSKK